MAPALRCTKCGVETEAKCSCHKPYGYIPAREAAALAVAAHPDWSDRRLAEAVGVSDYTIREARNSGARNHAPDEKRTGRDGKCQAAHKRSRKKSGPAESPPAKPDPLTAAFATIEKHAHDQLTGDRLQMALAGLEQTRNAFTEGTVVSYSQPAAGSVH
jgi:hypothetical protein